MADREGVPGFKNIKALAWLTSKSRRYNCQGVISTLANPVKALLAAWEAPNLP